MAIRIITGVPGSGKTYYAVHHLLNNYFKWDAQLDWWVPTSAEIRVVTNIDSFKIGVQLDSLMEKAGGPAKFFTVPYLKQVFGECQVLFVLDECQRYFDRKFYDKSVFYYFQYHRHMGHDVYLITQDVETLAKELRNLCEYQIVAARRSLSFFGEFRYRFVQSSYQGAEAFMSKVLKRDARVFAVYTSMMGKEKEKIASAPRRYAVWFAVCLLLIGVSVYKFYHSFLGGPAKAKPAVVEAKPTQAVTVKESPKVVNDVSRNVHPSRSNVLQAASVRPSKSLPDVPSSATSNSVDRVPFNAGFVRAGTGRITGQVGESREATWVIEENGQARIVEYEEAMRVFRRPPDGLQFGRDYPIYDFAATEAEARDIQERATARREARGTHGLTAQSAGNRADSAPMGAPSARPLDRAEQVSSFNAPGGLQGRKGAF